MEQPFFATQDTFGNKEPSLNGVYRDGVARVIIYSVTGQKADATLVRIGKYLLWRVGEWKGTLPKEHRSDPYAIPLQAVLKASR